MCRTPLSFLLLVLLFSNLGFSQNPELATNALYKVNNDEPGFSIMVIKGNSIILEKQYGIADLEYNIPITNETVFDIGSIGKQFTAAAILLLEKDGKLSIKEPAYKYIENLPRYEKGNPTIEHLLNQTSGIKEVDPYLYLVDLNWYDLLTQTQMINIITKTKTLNFSPGEYFQYTNANYILLANIIEAASGKSFSEYLQEHIFSPLEMENTTKKNSSYAIIKNKATGYIEEDGVYYKTHLHSTIYNGDGQISTTPRDMFKWHLGIKNATIGVPDLWKKMHTKAKLNNGKTINFGLGVEFETHNGYQAMGFDGMIKGGFVSKYLYFPELDIAFFTTQNTFDWDFRDRFFKLVDLYLPKKKPENNTSKEGHSKVIKPSLSALKKFEGNYIFLGNEEEEQKTNTLKLVNHKLILFTLDGEEIAELKPINDRQFLFNNNLVEFDLDEKVKQYRFYANENEAPWVFIEYEPHKHSKSELKAFEGQYFNADFQVSKKIKLEDNKLYIYYRNGAWKTEMRSLSRNIMEIPNYPIEFIRNDKGVIERMKIMDVVFKKL